MARGIGHAISVPGGANTTSLSPDQRSVVVGTANVDQPDGQRARVPRRRSRAERSAFDPGAVSAAYSPDGRLIVTADMDGAARLWKADTHRRSARWATEKN